MAALTGRNSMRFGVLVIARAAAIALVGAANAEPKKGELSLTIYNGDLALVKDGRTLLLPEGRSRQEFQNVSASIRPETVTVSGAGFRILEQNFDYDLLSPDKLMEKAVGREVTLVRTDPATGKESRERATVLAVNGGVVLRIGSRIEVLRDDGLPVRVIFDKVPENLRAAPTLSILMEADKAGARPVSLSYLTPGLSWIADYVALFDEGRSTIDVQGWVTLRNNSGAAYEQAEVVLVAGDAGGFAGGGADSLERAGTESGDREQLGDYYLYPLPAATTLADQQTKQVAFLDVKGAAARKAYEYTVPWAGSFEEAQSVRTVIKFSNGKAGGLGDQLPAGTVRVYMKDKRGQSQFIGENGIDHTPLGSELALTTGEAFDVKVRPVLVERQKLGDRKWRTTMRYELTNARATASTVDLRQSGLWGDAEIVSESLPSARVDANTVQWRVEVPANGSTQLTAVFQTRY